MAHDAAAVAELLTAAFAEGRVLPRVVPQPQELPGFTSDWIEAQREQGWFGDGLVTVEVDGQLVSLVDVRVEGEEAILGWFATHPDHRRRGYASACLQQALRYARKHGATRVSTHSLIDSRLTDACAFLEHHGFIVRDPDHQNTVWQIDMDRYEPRPFVLPEGYELRTLQMDRLDEWLAVRNAVFGPIADTWFMRTFGDRWDFDPSGWYMIYHGDGPVGIAAADFHRDPARPEVISGCQFEYVGVREEHRGKRLGEALMHACLNCAKEHGAKPCQLITQYFRTGAIAMYQKLGFRFMRENRVYERSLGGYV